jgi:myo-inositol-1(or 4)-monophosphatase
MKLNSWDVAAGTLIVREAGGRVTNIKGEEHSIYEPDLLATNSLIHGQMLELLQEADSS